ncbi:MAG: DUF1826 domain-containing protein [Ferrovibrio sp.]|uniref:DUF1826 domain-containing protein n=1 Tax=Ferrovibrio sp. TaxID=1917215 RepID=UPI00391B963D
MTAVLQKHALTGINYDVLNEIGRSGINLAIWHRQQEAALARLCTDIAAKHDNDLCLYIDPEKSDVTIPMALAGTGWGCETRLKPLANDVIRAVQIFARLTGDYRLHVDLSVIRTDACRYFHVDNVGLRLLCSYAGPGTEWLDNANVVRAALGLGDNKAVLRDPARIHHMPTGLIGILKGERYPGNDGNGIVHRSAPILRCAGRRLLLRIDQPGPHLPPAEPT